MLVTEGLPLKTNVPVGRIMIPVLKPPDQVLDTVPEVKRQNPQLTLLLQMNSFVVEQNRAGVGMPDQNEREQSHPIRAQRSNMNDKHTGALVHIVLNKN